MVIKMKKIKRLAGLIPALALSAMLTVGAGAQGVVNDVINGAENVVDDTVDTAENILGGNDRNNADRNNADRNNAARDNTVIGASDRNNDVANQVQYDAERNPQTGIGVPFMTAGLVAVSAAGLAYLTRTREGFKNKR